MTSKSAGAPGVLAVIVSYEPDESLLQNVRALRTQVPCVLLIDNGSANIDYVRCVAASTGCRLIANPSNFGIARAFNQAANLAIADGFRWLATFDQDSLVTPGLIEGLLEFWRTRSLDDEIGVLAPRHIDRNTRKHYKVSQHLLSERGDVRFLRTTISSGSLIPIEVLKKIGSFDEQLFIDFVDHDFCVRCRQHGYAIVESTGHTLIHSIGRLTEHRLLGRNLFCSNHSAVRRYYMTRNQLEVYRRYWSFDFWWCVRGVLDLAVGSVVLLMFESGRGAKLKAMIRGVVHFAFRRFGPLNQ